jgi:hypothetical protein
LQGKEDPSEEDTIQVDCRFRFVVSSQPVDSQGGLITFDHQLVNTSREESFVKSLQTVITNSSDWGWKREVKVGIESEKFFMKFMEDFENYSTLYATSS